MIPSIMAPGQKSLKIEYEEQSVSLNRYHANHSNTMSALSTDECLHAYFYEVRHDEPAGRRVGVVERCENVAAGGQGNSARGVWRVGGGAGGWLPA